MNEFTITKQVVDMIKAYQIELENKPLFAQVLPSEVQFTLLLSGISTSRITPGINKSMGFDTLYVCNRKASNKLRAHLRELYHIEDEQGLERAVKIFYRSHEEYQAFLAFYEHRNTYEVKDLKLGIQESFQSCMDYAYLFYPIVKEKGFLAWDVNEIIGLYRRAYACGLIDKAKFQADVMPLVKNCQKLYGDFKEYAISLLCGAIYFNYRQTMMESQSQSVFKLQRSLLNGLFKEGGAWFVYEWLPLLEKSLLIKLEDAKEVLRDYDGARGCIVSDRIMVDGLKVSYMYKDKAIGEWDSGWRFLAGDEDEDYLKNRSNYGIYDLNHLCNYDEEVIAFLDEEEGSCFIRTEDGLLQKKL